MKSPMKNGDLPSINKLLNKNVRIRTKNKEYRGTLKGYDGFLNVVLENTRCFLMVVRGETIIELVLDEAKK